MKLSEIADGTIVENDDRRIEYLGKSHTSYVGKIISTNISWEKPGEICESFSGSYDGWRIVTTGQDSIEYFQKKIEDTKSELNRLENTLKGLQDSKRMKELTETLSNLIVGKNYSIVAKCCGPEFGYGDIFIGTYTGKNYEGNCIKIKKCIGNYEYCVRISNIVDIVPMPEIDNIYTNLLSICERAEIKFKEA